MGKRYCAFYVIGVLASAFGGILAYGLMQMDGLAGKTGWRWIFIIEGIVGFVPILRSQLKGIVTLMLLKDHMPIFFFCILLPCRLPRESGSIMEFP